MKILVTGGAGFIGSHLVDFLMKFGHEVVILDNLSSGDLHNLGQLNEEKGFRFLQGDLKSVDDVGESLKEVDWVYHFAANPEVRVGETDPVIHFNENIVATFNLLEGMRKTGKQMKIVFASTSTVYGEADILPTPESYGPLMPISTYGASKLGCEALISSYCYTFAAKALILRLANVVGARSKHGIIADLIRKLEHKHDELEILGDGTQRKSYLHISDCISAIGETSQAFLSNDHRIVTYNVGSSDAILVNEIARIVVEEMGLQDVRLRFTGGVDGGRGWFGDVKNMALDTSRIRSLGWRPEYSSGQAIRLAVREMLSKGGHVDLKSKTTTH